MKDSMRLFLCDEIQIKLDGLSMSGKNWIPRLIAENICSDHKHDVSSDWGRYNVYQNVLKETKRYISKVAGDKIEGGNPQLTIPGYELIQSYYTVDRDGEILAVPILEMTESEWKEKAQRYRKMGETCFKHADELEKFHTKDKYGIANFSDTASK